MTDDRATEKLYLDNAYEVEFRAQILRCDETTGGRIAAVLDRTYFYPASGGQTADSGTINGIAVTDVWEEPGLVYHGLDRTLEPGEADCAVDWGVRFDHMQQHTGQHVLSRAFIEEGNAGTCSFHMGVDTCTIDLAAGELTEAVIERAESLANRVIQENRRVIVRTIAREEAEDDPRLRRLLPDGVEDVRLVEIEGFDMTGCCGTHVRRTGELAVVKVLRCERVKKQYRVHFKVGARAVRDYGEKHDIVRALANRFTTSMDGLEDKVDKLSQEKDRHRKAAQKLAKSLVAFEKEALLGRARSHGRKRIVVHVCEDRDDQYVRLLSSELKKEDRTVALIASPRGFIVCNASGDLGIDLAGPVVEKARSLGGSGGGKGGFATVQLLESAAVADFLEQVYADVKDL